MSDEKPNDDPGERSDWKNTKQTDKTVEWPRRKRAKARRPGAGFRKMARDEHALNAQESDWPLFPIVIV